MSQATVTIEDTAIRREDSAGLFAQPRDLTAISQRVYEQHFPLLKARVHFPVDGEGGPGAEYLSKRVQEHRGKAKIVRSYSNDFPRVWSGRDEFLVRFKSLGASYGFSFQDERAAEFAGIDLPDTEATAASRAIAEEENRIAYLGDEEGGLYGAFTFPYIPTLASSVAIHEDTTDTAENILRAVNKWANFTNKLTKNGEEINSVLMTKDSHTYLNTTYRNISNSDSLMDLFRKSNPHITFVDWTNYAAGAGYGGTDIMFFYHKSPSHASLHIPSDFEQLPPANNGSETVVKCHQRIGGFSTVYPLAHVKVEGNFTS